VLETAGQLATPFLSSSKIAWVVVQDDATLDVADFFVGAWWSSEIHLTTFDNQDFTVTTHFLRRSPTVSTIKRLQEILL